MTQEVFLPSSEADRKKILDAMQEISNSYSRIEAENSLVKEIIDDLSKKFTIPKPLLTKLSRVLFKGNFSEESGKFETFTELYDSLLSAAAATNTTLATE